MMHKCLLFDIHFVIWSTTLTLRKLLLVSAFPDQWSLADSSVALSVDHIVSVSLDFRGFFALLTLLQKAQRVFVLFWFFILQLHFALH